MYCGQLRRRAGRCGYAGGSLSEERDTIEEVIEPFLLKLGFLQRTPRGRVISDSGREYLGLPQVRKTRAADSQFDLLKIIEEDM